MGQWGYEFVSLYEGLDIWYISMNQKIFSINLDIHTILKNKICRDVFKESPCRRLENMQNSFFFLSTSDDEIKERIYSACSSSKEFMVK